MFFVFKQNTAYELRISDWSSDVCSSDLLVDDPDAAHTAGALPHGSRTPAARKPTRAPSGQAHPGLIACPACPLGARGVRSAERRVGKEGVSTCRSRW